MWCKSTWAPTLPAPTATSSRGSTATPSHHHPILCPTTTTILNPRPWHLPKLGRSSCTRYGHLFGLPQHLPATNPASASN
ncbi:hypothetical protein CCHR01_16391 [Colletotrichum chrysophilum]|uniref:Uncharacterized protein n=1 Tax=Colletotrichum chrysophilum TaxID=1836956 RepID=A0AAD9E7U8_9PEZI|nr:hypothetical protein CCHR01_16391 [Colletotrichum chrysophilum]